VKFARLLLFLAIRSSPLRGLRGSPYARSKTLAASRLASARYPQRKSLNDLQRAAKVATLSAHNESKHVAPDSTAEAVKNSFLRMYKERGVPFFVEGAKTNELPARATEPRVLPGNSEHVGSLLYAIRE
jgi:hypothetical protein